MSFIYAYAGTSNMPRGMIRLVVEYQIMQIFGGISFYIIMSINAGLFHR